MPKANVVPTIFNNSDSLFDAVETFIRAKTNEGRRAGTLITYSRSNREMAQYLGVVRPILSIQAADLRDFFGSLRNGHNRGGIEHYFRNVKAFFNWYWLEYEVDKFNPILKVKVEKQKPIPRRGIPMADFEKLLAACTTVNRLRDLAILFGLLDTCARGSEFCALSIKDVDLDTGQALIVDGKGGKSRYVRFGVKALRALRKYLRTRETPHYTEPLIATDEGEFFKYRALHLFVQRRIESAGTPQYGLHDFRRRGLYEMWQKTRDIKSVSVYAGHSNTTVTQVYLGVTDQDIMSVHIKGSPVDNACL